MQNKKLSLRNIALVFIAQNSYNPFKNYSFNRKVFKNDRSQNNRFVFRFSSSLTNNKRIFKSSN